MPRITSEDLTIVFEEAKNDSPRGAAIIMTTVLEASLEDALCARLLPYPMSNTHRDTLFGGEAGFAGLSAKIDLGYSLGLYGVKTKTDLHFIRKIRNEFAHYAPRSFSHPEIIKYCRNLTYYGPENLKEDYSPPEGSPEKFFIEAKELNMRWRFMHCVNHIGANLYGEITANNYRPAPPTILP